MYHEYTTGSLDLFTQLCMCTELDNPRACVQQWVEDQWFYAAVFIGGLFTFEGLCAIMAWKYVDEMEDDIDEKLKKLRKPKPPSAWGFNAGMNIADELQEKARQEAVLLTSTWYFEGTVLFASIVMFVVLAMQSRTVPPSDDMLVVLSIGEMFVTLFLSVDVFIQVVVCMTPAERRRIPKSPWLVLDISALIASWAYVVAPDWRVFSIGRVLRVLRPVRTLRMLSEIHTVLSTIAEALPLFFQACFLIFFLQMVFALVCMSLWSGGLNYECQQSAAAAAPSSDCEGGSAVESLLQSADQLLTDLSGAPCQPSGALAADESGSFSGLDVTYSEAGSMFNLHGVERLAGWAVGEDMNDMSVLPSGTFRCGACMKCPEDADGVAPCTALSPPREIRTEGYGFTGYDDFAQAMLTMFVQMTGDNGMQDIPFVLEDQNVSLSWFGWILMMVAVMVLTLLALNLFLAVCCAVFDDVHDQIFSKAKRAIERDQQYKDVDFGGAASPKNTGGGMMAFMKDVAAATHDAVSASESQGSNAREKLKTSEEKYNDYMQSIAEKDWTKLQERPKRCPRSVHLQFGWYRNRARDIVMTNTFRVAVNAMVALNALILMSAHHKPPTATEPPGMSDAWKGTLLALESVCMLFFWCEFWFKVFGFGWSKYVSTNTHRLDIFILFCTSAGWVGNALTVVAEVLPMTFPGYELFARGLHSLTSIRLVRLLRALQMSRWIYAHKQMRGLLETVFRSWESVMLISMFTIFSLLMFAVVSMHLLGGALGPDAQLSDYPRTNIETIGSSFYQSFRCLTGESWSGVMYFYMLHADFPQYGTALYFVIQFIWMRCILFSLFVAVLLVNFTVDEDDKMPRQRIKFDREEAAKVKSGVKSGSAILRALNAENMADEVKVVKQTSFEILTEANETNPYTRAEGEPQDRDRCSFAFFDLTHPFRLQCARIESHHFFDDIVMYMVLISCFVIAFESPELLRDYGMFFDIFNLSLLALFYVEMLIRMVVHGAVKKSGPTLPYVRNPLNRLDLFVIIVVTLSYILPLGGGAGRAMRVLRVLAPLLELMRNDSLRILINTFVLSLPAVGAIMFLLLILFAVFGIVGVEYFGGRLYQCVYEDDPYSVVPLEEVSNKTQCLARDGTLWSNPPYNFDNIFSAFVALYYMCINSGWAEIMESTLDISGLDQSPVENASSEFWVYYAFFQLIFGLFLLNLFIGVLSSAFSTQSGSNLTTGEQQKWIRIEAMLDQFAPEHTDIDRPEVGVKFWRVRQKMWDLAEDDRLENVWTAAILANVALLLLDHYPAGATWETFMELANLMCLLVFTAEIILKVGAYSLFGFLSTGWNQLDMFVVVGSWASKLFGVKAGVGVIRAFRTVRLVLLVKRLPSLMALMNTVIACVEPATNIAALSFIFFYLYAIIGMKLFGTAATDMEGAATYTEETNFSSFFMTLRLLFQQINGQDMKTIVHDLDRAGFGVTLPFLYLGSFFFLTVFINMNLFIVTVLDNFANLCSMDETALGVHDMESFADAWHKLTFELIWDVDPEEIDMEIDEKMIESMSEDEITELYTEKRNRENDVRLEKWAELKRQYPAAPYFEEKDAVFSGWLHRPNILAQVSQGMITLQDMHYFWIDADCAEPSSEGHLCLNWYPDGVSERDLDARYEKGPLKIERVQIKKVLTVLPAVKLVRQKTAREVAAEAGAVHADGTVNKMAAALSGRAWLVGLANAQQNHQENAMAAAFDLGYYEDVLGQEGYGNIESEEGLTEHAQEIEEEEGLTPAQARFRDCIEMGIEIPSNAAGCYACETEDYELFWPFFERVIGKLHKVKGTRTGSGRPEPEPEPEPDDDLEDLSALEAVAEEQPMSPKGGTTDGWVSVEDATEAHQNTDRHETRRWDIHAVVNPDVPLNGDLNLAHVGVRPVHLSVSAARNVVGFNLIVGMKLNERTLCEDLLARTFQQLIERPEWRGRYVSLTPGHPAEITEHEHNELVSDGLMFPHAEKSPEMVAGGLIKDWPHGRGCYISADEKTTIWVGYEDHVLVNVGGRHEKELDVLMNSIHVTLNVISSSPGVRFQHDPDRCGFVTSSPFRAGTGMQVKATVRLPKLTVDGTADRVREIIAYEQLQLAVAAGESEDADNAWGHFDLVDDEVDDGEVELYVTRTYGCTEAQIICSMFCGLKLLQAKEEEEEVFGGNAGWFAKTWLGKKLAEGAAKLQRHTNKLQDIMEEAEKAAERLAEQAAEAAQEAARVAQEAALEAQKQAMEAMEEAKKEAIAKAKEAQAAAAKGIDGISPGGGDGDGKGMMDGLNLDLDLDLPDLDIEMPDFLSAKHNPLAIQIEVVPFGPSVTSHLFRTPKKGRDKDKNQDPDTETTHKLTLIADSAEQHGAWVVALQWLADGCSKGVPAPRKDRRMYPGGIPPAPLNAFEWSKLKANVGLLDMPFSSVRSLIHLLQHKHALGVTQAFSREYNLWVTFQFEMYTYQTKATDLAQRLSGIEQAIEACDGCNFGKALQTMCLIHMERTHSLSYRKQCEAFEFESEYVAIRIIQTVVGAWVALRAREKFPAKFDDEGHISGHPHHPFWQRHPNIYETAVIACRDERLRTLGLMLKLVRKQEPKVDTAEFLKREEAAGRSNNQKKKPTGKIGQAKEKLAQIKQKGVDLAMTGTEREGQPEAAAPPDAPSRPRAQPEPEPEPEPLKQGSEADGDARVDAAMDLLSGLGEMEMEMESESFGNPLAPDAAAQDDDSADEV